MKKAVILAASAVIMLAGYFVIKYVDFPSGSEVDEHDEHDGHDHGGYITYLEVALIDTAEFVPAEGEAFTVTSTGNGFTLGDGFNAEELLLSVTYAATFPYTEHLGAPESSLSDYGLDPPLMTVRLKTASGEQAEFAIGGTAPAYGASYVLHGGELFLVDGEIAEQLTLPKNAYRVRTLWPGKQGDRPTLTEISTENYTVVRRDLDDDAPIGLSRYQLTAPVEFLCNDDKVMANVLNGILAIDLDEIPEGVEFEQVGTLTLKAEGFSRTIYVGGEVPDGGRYIMLDGDENVYIDRLGGYGFLDVKPLDLTYGLAFWLYKFDDVSEIVVVENGQVRRAPSDASEVNLRRFFAHVLNFSVAADALVDTADDMNRVELKMNDGTVHTLSFTKQNERQLAVSVDGQKPVFACNIKDWNQVIDDLNLLDEGKSVREG